MQRGYPVQLNLDGVSCVVVGGGKVAARKIKQLLQSGAKIVIISPAVTAEITQWENEGRVIVYRRDYKGRDELTGFRLVFAATSSEAVNAAVCEDAEALGLFSNNTSHSEGGTFLVPAALRRGSLVITVSTSGASPGLAVKLRDELESRIGWEYEEYVNFLAVLRAKVLSTIVEPQTRTIIFHNVLKFDILDLIRKGRLEEYQSRVFAELDRTHENQEWERILSPN
jgi:precorrin-2 dehydrogenase / sirohydrochlorin ferrochelatase